MKITMKADDSWSPSRASSIAYKKGGTYDVPKTAAETMIARGTAEKASAETSTPKDKE